MDIALRLHPEASVLPLAVTGLEGLVDDTRSGLPEQNRYDKRSEAERGCVNHACIAMREHWISRQLNG